MIRTILNSDTVSGSTVIINDRSFGDSINHVLSNIHTRGLAITQVILVCLCHDEPRGGFRLLFDWLDYDIFSNGSHLALALVMIQLVLMMVVATLTAFSKALLVTLRGSMIPISIMLPTRASFTSYP